MLAARALPSRAFRWIATWTILIVIIWGISELNRHQTQFGPGTKCAVWPATEAVSDLDIYSEIEKARKLGDQYGIDELKTANRVATVPWKATQVLVIDAVSRFDGGVHFYRRIRVLDGPLAGRALWVHDSDLLSMEGARVVSQLFEDAKKDASSPLH